MYISPNRAVEKSIGIPDILIFGTTGVAWLVLSRYLAEFKYKDRKFKGTIFGVSM